jgi:uncharacterized protein YyaL (SSP411 family)
VTTHQHTNRLIHETSPYLLQHAHNPVDWNPWGPEALEKARLDGRPVFLSIGYSACHWCHVMEVESFENEAIARILNEHFVSIKVDREERPDLDEVYMLATQLITRSGGWPMSVFLTPELKPFYAGTYFPPEDRFGRPGFANLLRHLADAWEHRRDEVLRSADQIAAAVAEYGSLQGEPGELGPDLAPAAAQAMLADFDSVNGGFGGAPKFPPSMRLTLMLREYRRTQDQRLIRAVTTTLDRMARGGIYDQVGGGFHRYSVDEIWLVPHFEKMLYDNALLAPVYLDSYETTGNEYHARIGREVLDYVLREMTDPRGGFYSTLDADSEGHEGKFYLWSPAEVEAILGPEDAALFCRVYDITADGNFEGKSIPNLIARPVEERAAELGMEPAALWAKLDGLREWLREARSHRIWPGLDDKVLTAWNGLMIRAMAAGYRVLGDDRYRAAAERAAEFILTTMQAEGRLLRSYREGQARLNGYLEDYSFLIVALLDLSEATGAGGPQRGPGNRSAATQGGGRWQSEAERLLAVMNEQFWDEGQGGYFFTAHDHEPLIARMKSNEDGAVPSGNSMAALALVRLAALTGNAGCREKAGRLLASYAEVMRRAPAAFANMLLAADLYQEGVGRWVLGVGSGKDEPALAGLNTQHLTPNTSVRIEAHAAHADGRVRLEVRLEIPAGWHINSHQPLQEYLRPTELRLEPGTTYRLARVDYPEGERLALPFDPEPLSVYQGTVNLTAEIEAPSSAGTEGASIPLRISYQLCSDRECLAPAEAAVEVRVTGDGT